MKNICRMPLLFLGLCLSTLAGAQAGLALLVKTDMDCNWELDGQPMDPLKADHVQGRSGLTGRASHPGRYHRWGDQNSH